MRESAISRASDGPLLRPISRRTNCSLLCEPFLTALVTMDGWSPCEATSSPDLQRMGARIASLAEFMRWLLVSRPRSSLHKYPDERRDGVSGSRPVPCRDQPTRERYQIRKPRPRLKSEIGELGPMGRKSTPPVAVSPLVLFPTSSRSMVARRPRDV